MRHAWTAAAMMVVAGIAAADETVTLQEKATPGVQRHVRVTLAVNGKMTTEKGDQPLAGQAVLQYPERVLEVDADGAPKKVIRYYGGARAKFMVAGEDIEHSLRQEVRMVVGERGESGCKLWSTGGPFTSDELEVVEDLLDVTRIPGLLPNKAVKLTEGWHIDKQVAQALCNLESVIGAELTGVYKDLKDGKAIVEIKGDAHGMQHGGEAKIKVQATLVYHVADAMVESLDWTQTDARAASPVAPAGGYKVRIEVKRDKSESPNLSDAAIAGLDLAGKAESKTLLFEGPNKRYRFLHPRDWHVTAARNNVVVMRCVRNNEFLGQLSIALLNDRAPGVSLGLQEFVKIVEGTSQMKVDPVEKVDELQSPSGVAIKRIVTTGQAPSGQLKLAHRHYLATGANGAQILFSFLCDPASVPKLQAADEGIVNSLEVLPTQAATRPPGTSGR
jgi:hypothetical protein